MKTAGHAVAVSGFTVGIGLLAMVVVPVPFIRSIGFGGLMIPIVSVLAALTLLPILLASIGERLDRRHNVERDAQAGAFWTRWSTWVVRRRWPAAIVGVGILAALAVVALGLNPGQPSVDSLSSGGEAKTALTSLEDAGVGTGVLTPIEVLTDEVEGRRRRAAAGEGRRRRAGAGADGPAVGTRRHRPAGGRAAERLGLLVGPRHRWNGCATSKATCPGDGRVGGPAAQDRDLTEAIYSSFPLMVAIIALVTFGLLARSQRSIVLPIKAILLNVLSIGAAFGIVVLIWQKGVGSDLIGGVPGDGGDRQLGAAGDLRLPLRALDGLRGVHPQPGPRGVRPLRRHRRGGDPRHRQDRPAGDERGDDPVPRLRRPRLRAEHRNQSVRDRPRGGDRPRRDGGADAGGAGGGQPAGQGELVAARWANRLVSKPSQRSPVRETWTEGARRSTTAASGSRPRSARRRARSG